MKRGWKPGDVGVSVAHGYRDIFVEHCPTESHNRYGGPCWHNQSGLADPPSDNRRPLVVIDPEDREQVERLEASVREANGWNMLHHDRRTNALQAALREFANPTPEEPTDPKARVTDRRENVWRLLADGDWVCTSGPDIGEYLVWWQLVERGPLTAEATA